MLMTVGCLLKVSTNLQQVKHAKQDINKEMQNKKNEAKKLISKPHGGRQKCVCGMWASSFTHTSTWSLYEDSFQNEHWIVHPKISLQSDLLPSI